MLYAVVGCKVPGARPAPARNALACEAGGSQGFSRGGRASNLADRGIYLVKLNS